MWWEQTGGRTRTWVLFPGRMLNNWTGHRTTVGRSLPTTRTPADALSTRIDDDDNDHVAAWRSTAPRIPPADRLSTPADSRRQRRRTRSRPTSHGSRIAPGEPAQHPPVARLSTTTGTSVSPDVPRFRTSPVDRRSSPADSCQQRWRTRYRPPYRSSCSSPANWLTKQCRQQPSTSSTSEAHLRTVRHTAKTSRSHSVTLEPLHSTNVTKTLRRTTAAELQIVSGSTNSQNSCRSLQHMRLKRSIRFVSLEISFARPLKHVLLTCLTITWFNRQSCVWPTRS